MPRLEARHITMQFPAVRALDDFSLDFEPGEVHGIIGENGAGKSTLMKILSGIQKPTKGEIALNGKVLELKGPRDALRHGIAMIHQELDVIDELTVAENVFLGREPTSFGWLHRRKMEDDALALLQQVGATFSPSQQVGELSIAGKQLVEIAKALSQRASILIMDEPTAVLTEVETAALFGLIQELSSGGVTVIYISHRLAEVDQLCDRITVMRDGALVKTLRRGEASETEMASMMVGRPMSDMFPPKRNDPHQPSNPSLVLDRIAVPGWVDGVSLTLEPGEIVGMAGLIGSGRTELAESLVGARKISSGSVSVEGKPLKSPTPRKAAAAGLAYVSEDRKGAGLVLSMSVIENTTLANLSAFGRMFIDKGRERKVTEDWVQKLDIRAGDLDAAVLYLSGGNQQKVAVAKWLEVGPRVLILDEPTRGVDVGAKHELYKLIRSLADGGLSCLIISSELPELIGLCDRVFVMRQGKVVGEVAGEEMTEERIMWMAAGVSFGGAA